MRSSQSLANIDGSLWSSIRKNWTTLSQIAAGVMAVVATIVAPPPTPVGTLGLRAFASFVVAILAAIFLLVLRRLKKQEHALLWAATAAILLFVTIVDYFWYFNLIDTRTEAWHGRTVVCGTELRPEIRQKYGSILRKSLVRQLLDDAAGDPELIWTDRSIRSSEDFLSISYLIIVPLIGGCIMAASQVATCRGLPPRKGVPLE
jgi:amino acid transporter